MITSLLPVWLETRTCPRPRQRGLNPVYLVQCLFLLYSLFLCVAYSCAVVDEKRSHHWCDTGANMTKIMNSYFSQPLYIYGDRK